MKLVILAGLVASAAAECNNACNGRGRCTNYKMMFSAAISDSAPYHKLPSPGGTQNSIGYNTAYSKKDSCTCFTREEQGETVYAFTGADCSLMTCPFGHSWAGAPMAANNHNQYEECSGRGICDRKTGECECFPPYEGVGCRRTGCPNDCSHHGVCKTAHEITKLLSERTVWDAFSEFEYTLIQYSTSWDSHIMRGCECDAGWRGPDCSIKEAPSSSDPMGGEGSSHGRVCSGRGMNVDGVCECFPGYFGTACGSQRATFQ